MKPILVTAACALALAGCASSTDREVVQAHAAIWQYCDAASSGPEAAVIGKKTFIEKVTELNAAMLSDPAIPTQQEADALKSLDARRSICREKIAAWVMQYQPGQAPILQQQFYKEDIALGDLIHRAASYGDANRRIYEAFLEATNLATTERKAEIEAAREEQMRRLAIAEAIIANTPKAQLQPAYTPLPHPTNCITSYTAGSAYTTCQ